MPAAATCVFGRAALVDDAVERRGELGDVFAASTALADACR